MLRRIGYERVAIEQFNQPGREPTTPRALRWNERNGELGATGLRGRLERAADSKT